MYIYIIYIHIYIYMCIYAGLKPRVQVSCDSNFKKIQKV